MSLKLVNWNVEWATPRSRKSAEILRRIQVHDPEIVCLTETDIGLLSGNVHVISSQENYGYRVKRGRRKVALWSKRPWVKVDDLGTSSMPPGRFVSGITDTSLGQVTVVGICIPWSGSRVRWAAEKRRLWEDHREYLAGLGGVLGSISTRPLIVVGDFNQRIGQGHAVPKDLRTALQKAMPPGMTIATSGLGLRGLRSIDHIAVSGDLAAESTGVMDNIDGQRELSDHFGVYAYLSAGGLPQFGGKSPAMTNGD